MSNLDLKKLKRSQLLDLILIQQKKIEQLDASLKKSQDKIDSQNKYIDEFKSLDTVSKRFYDTANKIETLDLLFNQQKRIDSLEAKLKRAYEKIKEQRESMTESESVDAFREKLSDVTDTCSSFIERIRKFEQCNMKSNHSLLSQLKKK